MNATVEYAPPDYVGQWVTAPMTCRNCRTDWIAVYPVTMRKLACEKCGAWTPTPITSLTRNVRDPRAP